jgi:hypothetical protein
MKTRVLFHPLLAGALFIALKSSTNAQLVPETPEAFLKRLEPSLKAEPIRDELSRRIVESVDWDNLSLSEAVGKLNHLISAENSTSKSLQIPHVRIDKRIKSSIPPGPLESRSSVHLKNSSLEAVLNYSAGVNALALIVRDNGIWLRPAEGFDSIPTQIYLVPQNLKITQKTLDILREKTGNLPGTGLHLDPKTRIIGAKLLPSGFYIFELWYAHQLLKLGYKIPKA